MCYGGYARRVTKIKEVRESHANVLLLDNGEMINGIRAWFETYGGIAASHFMNKIGYNATGLGPYDFTNGIDALVPFLNDVTFPVVLTNVDSKLEPRMRGLYVQEHVLTFGNGEQVGLVGFIWEQAPIFKNVGNLLISKIIPRVQVTVNRLQSQGINKIIALGLHVSDAEEVARMVRGVDIIVTGSLTNHTFLWNGQQPSVEPVDGPYPLVVNNVLIVTTYQYGKYLGYLNVAFNSSGEVITFDGNPILLDDSCPEDPDALAEINAWKTAVENVENEIVGESCVDLYGLIDRCGVGDCNMGNLIADSMIWEWNKGNRTSDDGWAHVTMAMFNTDLFTGVLEAGAIAFVDIKEWLPWGDTFDLVTLKGRYIVDALEQGVSPYENGVANGMRVIYDMTKPKASRVQDVQVLCRECNIPEYAPIEVDKEYKIAMNSWTVGGGHGQDVVLDNLLGLERGRIDTGVVRDYIAELGVVKTGLDNRYIVYDSQYLPPCPFPMRSGKKLRKRP